MKDNKEIDELLLKKMIAGEETIENQSEVVIERSINKEDKEEKNRRKKLGFRELFLQPNVFKERHCVYISQKNFETIDLLVRLLNMNNITIGSYVDNVLNVHIEQFKNEILEIKKQEIEKYKL